MNEATFREANESLHGAAEELRFEDPIPFICECSDPSCTELVRLERAQYRAVRDGDRRFFVVVGHERNSPGPMEIVEQNDSYVVIEKRGAGGEVAAATASS